MVNSDTMSSLIDRLQPSACRKEDTMRYLADAFEPAENLHKKNWANLSQLKNMKKNKGSLPPTQSLLDPLPRGASSCRRFSALVEDLQAPPLVIYKRRVQCVHSVQDESVKFDPICNSSQKNIVPPLYRRLSFVWKKLAIVVWDVRNVLTTLMAAKFHVGRIRLTEQAAARSLVPSKHELAANESYF